MIVAVNVVGEAMGTGLGRAQSMAIADVEQGQIESWEVFDVRWDLSHDAPDSAGHGAHHARIVRFMKEHGVEAVVTGHAGPPMVHTLDLMGIGVLVNAEGDARQAAIDGAAALIEARGNAS